MSRGNRKTGLLPGTRKWIGTVGAFASLALVAGCTAPGDAVDAAQNTLVVATAGPPSTLDPHRTSAFLDQQIAWHVYEGL